MEYIVIGYLEDYLGVVFSILQWIKMVANII